MRQLTTNWFTEGIIDFEHKKYLLLAYLQHVSKQFDETKLYPFLSDLVFHYQNVKSLKQNRAVVLQQMPKKLRNLITPTAIVGCRVGLNLEPYSQVRLLNSVLPSL